MNFSEADVVKYMNDLDGNVAYIRVEMGSRVLAVPLSEDNTDYAEIMRQVEAGELTIQDADS